MESPVAAVANLGVDVRDDDAIRTAYSSDASLYRVRPLAVVRPRRVEEIAAVLALSRDRRIPVTARGGGTSLSGNAIGPGLILDTGRHMNRVLSIDPDAAVAVVEPGVVPARLNRAAAQFGLRFGPDPSTHTRCTIGGMIGNNSCGARSLGYGRTVENVEALDVITGVGEELSLPAGKGDSPTLSRVADLVAGGLATIRTEFGRFDRQISGYALEHLLPERGFDVARALVGSEGTLAVVTRATVRLVPEPAHRTLVALGYPDIIAAADAGPAVRALGATACEGIDARTVDVVRNRRGPGAVPPLPRGNAWLFVELAGSEPIDDAAARRLAADCGALDAMVVADPVRAARLWRIREDGAGLSGRSEKNEPAYPGWEDAAVPPEQLGAYLRDFDTLLAEFGLTAVPYGHFGEGCVHARIDFPLDRRGGPVVLREFITAAADLVAGFGGSLAGEHGDGRARSALLDRMYSPAALRLFAGLKRAFDPDNLLNPGVLVDPRPIDTDLRDFTRPPAVDIAFRYRSDAGDFTRALHRCTGVGKCRADNTAAGAVMCPSYLATREEQDSTRGRARVLQGVIDGGSGWRAPEVHAALDLCLACKGCAVDCPTGVDMATYKAEVLHQTYRGRVRPVTHYTLGRLPRWARLAARAPRMANSVLHAPGIGPALRALAGIDRRRDLPRFAPQTFRAWFESTRAQRNPAGERVLLFVDTFTDHFAPEVGQAAVAVLEAAGLRPEPTPAGLCCALTWLTTGQLDSAARILSRTVTALEPAAAEGVPLVGLEPSCTAVLRSDAVELLGTAAAETVAAATHTLAELLTARGVPPPRLDGLAVVAQPHCHHHAVMNWDTDAALLAAGGADVHRVGGCCGLAGNFGVEKGHYDVSVAVAEHDLLPAVAAAPAAVVLADGFSCRTQLADLAARPALHLAQLLLPYLQNDP